MPVMLISPPFVQLNSPYSALPYLKGILNANGIENSCVDIGISIANRLFSAEGLNILYERIASDPKLKNEDTDFFIKNRTDYIKTIEPVLSFLKGMNPGLESKIPSLNYLPKWKMSETALSAEFSSTDDHEYARYLASLYIEDIFLFYKAVCPEYDLSKYGEKLALSPPVFDNIYRKVLQDHDIISGLIDEKLNKNDFTGFNVIAITVPFPGTLLGALKIARWFKMNHPEKTVVLGGGYINTELRNLKDPKIFEFADFICLDDGEVPLLKIIEYSQKKIAKKDLVRTFYIEEGKVVYSDNSAIKSEFNRGTPDYSGFSMNEYFPVIETLNPMMKLWSERNTLKLRLARGCYWHKCAFCDTTLPYIKDFVPEEIKNIIEDIKLMVVQTGLNTFHFTDEAIPPALAVKLSIELIREKIEIKWWGNIRFDKAFTEDVCKLLYTAGCIAVVGGLESCCDSTLKNMNKGVSVEEAVRSIYNFKSNSILVHAYMIYSFPGETVSDLIDSAEVLRQLFNEGLLDSAYWHRFALTRHSAVFKNSKKFNISVLNSELNTFANNDVNYIDNSGSETDDMGSGLKKAVYNFMLGIDTEKDIRSWFDINVPKPKIKKDFVRKILDSNSFGINTDKKILWLGKEACVRKNIVVINGISGKIEYELPKNIADWLCKLMNQSSIFIADGVKIQEAMASFPKTSGLGFTDFVNNEIWDDLFTAGLIII